MSILALLVSSISAIWYSLHFVACLGAGGTGVPYPEDISLMSDPSSSGKLAFRGAQGERLFTYAFDEPGKSNCDDLCSSAWHPLLASRSAHPVGRWTMIERNNGSQQWAIDGRPVYFRFHNLPMADDLGYSQEWREVID